MFRWNGAGHWGLIRVLLLGSMVLGLGACSPPTDDPKPSRTVTVTFDDDGATVPVGADSVTVEEGRPLGQLPEAPARESALFMGWYTAREGGESFTSTTPVSADLTVYARWRLATENNGTFLPSMALSASSDGRVVLAMPESGFGFAGISTDGGASWAEIAPFPEADPPDSVVGTLSPNGTYVLLQGWYQDSMTAQVWYSADRGTSWTVSSPPSFLLGPVITDSGVILAGQRDGELWRSTDAGSHWTVTTPFSFSGGVELWLDRDGSTLVATAYNDQMVAFSDDLGAQWTTHPTPGRRFSEIAFSSDGTRVTAIDGGGNNGPVAATSLDRGATWVTVAEDTPSPWGIGYLGSTLWVRDMTFVYRSTASGTWDRHFPPGMLSDMTTTDDKVLGWSYTHGLISTTDGTVWTWAGRSTTIQP